MWVYCRKLTIISLAGYLLAVTASAHFHTHHSDVGEHAAAGLWASHGDGEHGCRVCEFQGHKPVPVAPAALVVAADFVVEVAPSAPPAVSLDVFSAWHSRAPPVGA